MLLLCMRLLLPAARASSRCAATAAAPALLRNTAPVSQTVGPGPCRCALSPSTLWLWRRGGSGPVLSMLLLPRCRTLLIQARSVRSSLLIAAASSSLSTSLGHSCAVLSSSSGQLLRGLLHRCK